MYVSSEVRRREIPESTPDPSHYAASTNGASFLAILAEVGRSKDDFSDRDDVRAREVAPDSPGELEKTEDDPAVIDGSTEEANTTSTTEAEEADDSESSPTESVATESTPTTPVTAPVTQTVVPVAEVASTVETSTLPLTTAPAENLPTDPLGILAETGTPAKAAEPVASLESSVDGGLAESIEGANDPALSSEITMEMDVEPAPAPPVFAKTLNAILAEDAVRPAPENVAAESAPPKSEDVAALAESATDTSTEMPDSTPIPHATAMQSGGVRPQTTGIPRLPMANLPGELAQQIHLMQQEGARTMRLRLVPENLGELQIEIQGTGDAMKVRLISGNPAVRDALESQMGDLKDAMEKQGLALDQATVGGEADRRGPAPDLERTPGSTPYREAPAPAERSVGSIRQPAPIALGTGALNILA